MKPEMNEKLKMKPPDNSMELLRLCDYEARDYGICSSRARIRCLFNKTHLEYPTVREMVDFIKSNDVVSVYRTGRKTVSSIRYMIEEYLLLEEPAENIPVQAENRPNTTGTYRYKDTIVVLKNVETIDIVPGESGYDIVFSFISGNITRLHTDSNDKSVAETIVEDIISLIK